MSIAAGHTLHTLNPRNAPRAPQLASDGAAWPNRPGQAHAPYPHGTISDAIRAPRRFGFLVLLAFLGSLGGWAALAPLSGGAIAAGQISPDSGVRTIEHLEGGLVKSITVRDGDTVHEGDVLMTLDVTARRSEAEALADRRLTRIAEQARIAAEIAGSKALAIPEDFSPQDPVVASAFQVEQRALDAKLDFRNLRERLLRQRIAQLEETISGHSLQVRSAAEQLALMHEELEDKLALLGKGLAAKGEVLRLRRAIADMEGLRGSQVTAVAEARKEIGEIEMDLKAREAEDVETLAVRAVQIRSEIAEIEKSLLALDAVLGREQLRSPVDGIVSNIRIRNAGAIIQPGEAILDVVPARERLLIDARISPNDIDAVEIGMPANIRLSAFSGRSMPQIVGTVTMVSADTARAENSNTTYYPIRVEVDASELSDLNIELRSGMLVSVLVVTRERSVLSYLWEPFEALLQNGMREG
ncbi:HlyD family type I secretion periplasmic adaptor subunit [Salipiger mangrovisoli]|uniref:Membrane fusion protein (MFP) family protein n=1 Tax=Salipiger mangrovisoli TaxID=2865933 RepID=A0ABR9WY32_9RHOB|nr:HlyD family type I secretion periplasmic adaptor subunit [Salipiger mangrovisoli]MBE9636203.1 HlyD family type I secretion periplasmic adaptor subunit [Salipiger mangrovisoli]